MDMHALVVTRGINTFSPERNQVQGFAMYERELGDQLGLTVELVPASNLAETERVIQDHRADVVFVRVAWSEKAEEVVALFQRIAERVDRPKIVFLDYYAQLSSPFYGVLPFVDVYVKRQMYADPANLTRDFEGGNMFTDFLAKRLGYDLDGWSFGSFPDPAHLHKIIPGWNLGVASQYRKLLKLSRFQVLPWNYRPFAINARLGLAPKPWHPTDWYQQYRQFAVEVLEPLRREFRCTPWERVKRRRYFTELLLSKVGLSPFGWGEVCFRDYELVASGALLIKPSMSHLTTNPDIYRAGETYVEAAWDLSDVPDLCRYYLAHPAAAKKIIRNARVALGNYFEKAGFVRDVGRVLEAVDPSRARAPSAVSCAS